jgi:hypothetical protein
MNKGNRAKFVRTIVYVFGPKSCYPDYKNNKPICLEDGNWLKIGEAHSEDCTTDKLEIAMERIKQEVHTGIPYTCRLYDAFEFPYKRNTDKRIRDILAEELFGLPTSKSSNKLITDVYEIKAGREYVYGATRKQIKNALDIFELEIVREHRGKSDFDTIMGYIDNNTAEFDSPSEDDNTTRKSPLNGNVFWPKVLKELPDNIKMTHGNNKSYVSCSSSNQKYWYAANYRVRFNDAYVAIETYGGEAARKTMNDLIRDNSIPLVFEERPGVKNPEKWGWYFTTELENTTEEELQEWFVKNITLVYNLIEQALRNSLKA